MNKTDLKRRIKCLAETMRWQDKKILYFVSNTEQATLFLEYVNLNRAQLRLVRDKELSMFCNYLFIGEEVYPVKDIAEDDFIWADEVILMTGQNAVRKFLEKYAGICAEEKVRIYDTPYESLQRIYSNAEGTQFRILDKLELDTEHKILENDIPFIEESFMSRINKKQEESYFTYSMGRRNLVRGIYFDEKEIAEIKRYHQFNKDTEVVVFGKKVKDMHFTEESILLYKAVYGNANVAYAENPADYTTEDNKDYLFIHAGVRMISPFIAKYYKTMREKTANPDMIGLVSPKRLYCPEDIGIIWGNRNAFARWKCNSAEFKKPEYWYQYVMAACIVAEDTMFNKMDFYNSHISCRDKESRIGYAEWVIGRMELR